MGPTWYRQSCDSEQGGIIRDHDFDNKIGKHTSGGFCEVFLVKIKSMCQSGEGSS